MNGFNSEQVKKEHNNTTGKEFPSKVVTNNRIEENNLENMKNNRNLLNTKNNFESNPSKDSTLDTNEKIVDNLDKRNQLDLEEGEHVEQKNEKEMNFNSYPKNYQRQYGYDKTYHNDSKQFYNREKSGRNYNYPIWKNRFEQIENETNRYDKNII